MTLALHTPLLDAARDTSALTPLGFLLVLTVGAILGATACWCALHPDRMESTS